MRPVDPLLVVHVVWRAHPQRFRRRGLTTETKKSKKSVLYTYRGGEVSQIECKVQTFKCCPIYGWGLQLHLLRPWMKFLSSFIQRTNVLSKGVIQSTKYIDICSIYQSLNKWSNTKKHWIKLHHFDYFIHWQHDYSMPPETNPVLNQISLAWNIMVFIYLFCLFLVPLQGTIWTGFLRCTWPNQGSKSTYPLCKSSYRPLCVFHFLFGNFVLLKFRTITQSPQWLQQHHGLHPACSVIL